MPKKGDRSRGRNASLALPNPSPLRLLAGPSPCVRLLKTCMATRACSYTPASAVSLTENASSLRRRTHPHPFSLPLALPPLLRLSRLVVDVCACACTGCCTPKFRCVVTFHNGSPASLHFFFFCLPRQSSAARDRVRLSPLLPVK